MATRTKPLMTAAALVSAAAVAVATPAIAPSVLSSTAPALSVANVNLANFADVLSIPGSEWNNIFYAGWGGAIGPINVDPQTTESDYWLPNCDYNCTVPGVSGVAYLALDALINGNGTGYANASSWGVSAVNYFFEGGISPGVQYIVEKPFLSNPVNQPCTTTGVTCGPLYNPQIASLIALAFQGGYALTTLYVTGLSVVAQAVSTIPYIGQYLYRGIGSYIGPAFQTVDSVYDYGTYAGIPGVERYIGGVITTGGNPNPYPLVQTPSASVVAAKAPAAVTAATVAASAVSVSETKAAASSTDATSTGSASTPASSATETAPTSASSAVADTTAAATSATKPSDAPAKSRKRPVRDALAGAAKSITSAVTGAAGTTSSAAAGASAAS